MFEKSKKSAKAATKQASDSKLKRPFAKSTWEAAQLIAAEYQVIVSFEDNHWYGRGLEFPSVFGDGETAEKCIEQTREALAVAVACLMEANKKPPTPARMGKRTQQVNVRLTAEERAMLDAAAKKRGFQGLSDFIRAVALESVG